MAHDGVEHAELFEFQVADDDFDAASATEMLSELFSQIDRAMLPAGATKAHH